MAERAAGVQPSSSVQHSAGELPENGFRLDLPSTIMCTVTPTVAAVRPLPGGQMEPNLASLLESAERGNPQAADALFSTLYSELHRIAKRELARRGLPVSLGATTLLHQAYIEMAAKDGAAFPDEARFMAYASRVMRGLIIDYARNRSAQKRGGQFHITSSGLESSEMSDERELAQIGETLDDLARAEPALAEIVDMKFFCGFTFAEIAAMKKISERTAQRQWEKARIYLHHKLSLDLES
jgi:RNA polymerase sigma factor (TIGR02999 family)